MRSRALLGLFLAAAMVLAGCTTDDEPTDSTGDGDELAAPEDHGDHEHGDGMEHDGDDADGDEAMEHMEGDGNATEAPNTAPVAELAADLLEGTVPFDVNFTLAGADAEGDDLSWTFDADGDGVADSEGSSLPFNFTFSYVDAGNYTAVLEVSDGTEVHNQTVTITATEAVEEAAEELVDDPCTRPDAVFVPGLGLWLDDRGDPFGTGFLTGGGTWLYQESNGVEGLQLTSEASPDGLTTDPDGAECENGDTLIF